MTQLTSVRWRGRFQERKGIEAIGRTPLIEIKYEGCAPIIAKAEFMNPTGSHKDRGYLAMINNLNLRRNMLLVDYTSGNAGASLAFIAKELGIKAAVIMPADMTQERIDQIRSYGAELLLTDSRLFIAGARAEAESLVAGRSNKAVLLNQSENPINQGAYAAIADEFEDAMGVLNYRCQVFVGAIGTGASTTGISKRLKSSPSYATLDERRLVVGFEAAASPTSFSAKYHLPVIVGSHRLIGVSPGRVAKNTDLSFIDRVDTVTPADVETGKQLLAEISPYLLGHSVGPTSAAALYLAKRYAQMIGDSGVRDAVLTVFYDAGWKYASESAK